MSPDVARALRRAALASAALAATLAGHALTAGEARVLPVAPLMWLSAVALAILPGATRRRAPGFRAWSAGALLAALLCAQAALHLLLHGAPWALGLAIDHSGHAPLITPSAAGIHVVLALGSMLVLRAGQDLLLRALDVARAVVRALRPSRPRRSLARPAGDPLPAPPAAASQWRGGPRSSRGPPAPALPPDGPRRIATAH